MKEKKEKKIPHRQKASST